MRVFDAWLERSGVSQSDVARSLGATRQLVSLWRKGKVIPGLYYALAIEAMSGGEVEATSWITHEQRLALVGLSIVAKETKHVE